MHLKGKGGEKLLEDGSKELTYEEGEFRYRDRYFGNYVFSGEEVVWFQEKVVWSMNYYGKQISDVITSKILFLFLQKALRAITQDKPFRGPSNLKEEDFEYVNEVEGDLGNFRGFERILYKGEEVYNLKYHGGFVVKK